MKRLIATLMIALLATCLAAQAAQKTAPKTTSKAKTTAKAPAAPAAKPAEPAAPEKLTAIFDTSAGQMACDLFLKDAPETVKNFVGLATGTKDWVNPKTGKMMHGVPLYDGVIFHRVIPNFMIQGGDPMGTGQGNPGYAFKDEFVTGLDFDRPGRLAMANAGPGTNGSQFFITEVPTPHLNHCDDEAGCQRGPRMVAKGFGHTIFGQCDDATVALVKQIARMPTDRDRPMVPVVINHITIHGLPEPAKKKTVTPAPKTTPKAAPKTTTKTAPKTTTKK